MNGTHCGSYSAYTADDPARRLGKAFNEGELDG